MLIGEKKVKILRSDLDCPRLSGGGALESALMGNFPGGLFFHQSLGMTTLQHPKNVVLDIRTDPLFTENGIPVFRNSCSPPHCKWGCPCHVTAHTNLSTMLLSQVSPTSHISSGPQRSSQFSQKVTIQSLMSQS